MTAWRQTLYFSLIPCINKKKGVTLQPKTNLSNSKKKKMKHAHFVSILLMLWAAPTVLPATLFEPYRPTALRLPSVPLVVNDPYFSIWSPYDQLNEGATRHWTHEEKPLEGFLRVDGKVYQWMGAQRQPATPARQRSVSVMATSTYYQFDCGDVTLNVVFTAPMLIDDYDLLSAPVNYISYEVRSANGQKHDVQLLLTASPLLAVANPDQPTRLVAGGDEEFKYVRCGTIEQPILAKKGDGICIDWGYLYLPAVNGQTAIATAQQALGSFASQGCIESISQRAECRDGSQRPLLCYWHDFGLTSGAASYAMIGYDEVEDIEYMFRRYKAYWAHKGTIGIVQLMKRMKVEYAAIMQRCREMDRRIYDDALKAGNEHYAEMLSAVYRHVMAAHKLFQDDEGNLLFFSKENNSNGCVNTVDLTYPEAPLLLCYNPELQKAMMTSILNYTYSGRWTKPFPAHDLGTYPIANGQAYGADMPIEEAGNMLILAAELCRQDGSTAFVDKYWDIVTTWADYLAEHGQDPEEQLCTDDFAGHWAHNANLAVKAIMGVAGYAAMARLKGLEQRAEQYMERAKAMARQWELAALDGDHYRLAFDRPGTWSQKYNMVWDRLWQTGIFGEEVMIREINYYLTQQQTYGLPLDCRKDYSKNDWILWTAAMAESRDTFLKMMEPVYRYMNETESRVPVSDWYDTKTAQAVGFKARSVIGGFWMRVLMDRNVFVKPDEQKDACINSAMARKGRMESNAEKATGRQALNGKRRKAK